MTRIPLTHKGWFGPCPVYSAGKYHGIPVFVERHWTLTPLMMITFGVFALALIVHTALNPDHEPDVPLTITGRIAPGRVVELPTTGGL